MWATKQNIVEEVGKVMEFLSRVTIPDGAVMETEWDAAEKAKGKPREAHFKESCRSYTWERVDIFSPVGLWRELHRCPFSWLLFCNGGSGTRDCWLGSIRCVELE